MEGSHRIDQEEFYQLWTSTVDMDLNKKLEFWEQFYNFAKPPGSFDRTTTYKKMRSLLKD